MTRLLTLALSLGLLLPNTDASPTKECGALGWMRDRLGIHAVRREFVFARLPEEDLGLDIYYPRRPAPAAGYPVIVWIHGGGWILGSKRQDVFVRHFPRYGYAVVSVEYRLAAGAKFPAQMLDVRLACRWIFDHAKELGLDRNRLALSGQSAGGHLALLAAFTQGESLRGWGPAVPAGTFKAVAAMYPPTDLLALVPPEARDNPLHPVAILLGGPVREQIPKARAASPIAHARRGVPPTLLLHGAKDTIVPAEQSQRLAARLRALGVPVKLTLTPDGHAFTLYPDKVDDVLAFLKSVPAFASAATEEPEQRGPTR